MQQTPPSQSPLASPELPVTPPVVPVPPTRRRQSGKQAPSPDAVAVRRLVVPDHAPPYDDELPDDVKPPYDVVPRAEAACATAGQQTAADQPTAAGNLPSPADAGYWPGQFAQVLAETLAGARPARQLTPWTTEQARQRIRQLGPTLVTDQRPRVRRIVTSAPSRDVLELTAVVGFGPRVRAVALRLERQESRPYRTAGDRWCCTAIESA
jgi:Family of unknown function (DUF6459)